ncbi:PREDICTED: palmitoyltransferase ZDHHC15-like isoform X1 [Branchiostoma belcheri]|uniref:Palmitoyltransferase n=1 Tax=Branchiostoma belcheri TaxID=7741 RepID=A0A6P4YUA3_BRABE|nr:PREDICTED: palmitoyltransferase ZDHHC15-like isoform X1 [Branchiostoma belcheri]KAI8508393.1 Palmitoyltransferase zdhhc2 [Branchiostoma belcheri]
MSNPVLNFCIRLMKWLPVVFITLIVLWSYYAYVVEMCVFAITSLPQKVIYLVLYHIFFLIFVWSYYQTIFAPVGRPSQEFYLSKADVDRLEHEDREDRQQQHLAQMAKDLPLVTRTIGGSIRYCEPCQLIKPDRCHHCSMCGTCVLKMDHHCPWVNNCVGYSNYKFFVLFLGYGLLYCIYVAGTSVEYFIKFWNKELDDTIGNGRFHILFLFFAAAMFSISLVSLFGYHLYLVFSNRTTLESFRTPMFRHGPDKDGFNLGSTNNLKEVFGEDRRLWFLPVFTSLGDGLKFPTRVQYDPTEPAPTDSPATESPDSPDSVGFGDGMSFPTRRTSEDSHQLLNDRQRWAEEGEGDVSDRETALTTVQPPGRSRVHVEAET